MTFVQKTVLLFIGVHFLSSAVILLVFDLNAVNHFMNDFSWLHFFQNLYGTVTFYTACLGVFFFFIGAVIPLKKT
ncbi:hypothetical protein [Bacillus safensis]|uniref:hypothetical protein n=1 Tax=Bacillus safensis TaxID=561879 RepID=UPI002281B432|nr:hypothetical protein [Bacillus safensis]MCY7675436.1 hypothetical protein [Bacillus safensis]MCY7699157.1 hypothetical protein [Bacillus safensis]MEC3626082.1 hypothetical protein [Bacillus safensis]